MKFKSSTIQIECILKRRTSRQGYISANFEDANVRSEIIERTWIENKRSLQTNNLFLLQFQIAQRRDKLVQRPFDQTVAKVAEMMFRSSRKKTNIQIRFARLKTFNYIVFILPSAVPPSSEIQEVACCNVFKTLFAVAKASA